MNADLSHWVVVCERVFDCPAHERINGSDEDWWPQVLSLVRLYLRVTHSNANSLLLIGAQVAQHAHLLHARVAYREGTAFALLFAFLIAANSFLSCCTETKAGVRMCVE